MTEALADREFQRILLIKPSSLGDVVHALPILAGLRRRYPSAHISWMIANQFVDLIDGHRDLDEVIPFDRKRFGRLGRSLGVSVEFARYVLALRRRRFDLVVDLQGLFRSGFLAWAAGARVRIGPARSRELAWMFYNHRFPIETMESHMVDRMWAVATLLGFADVPKVFNLPIGDEDRTAVRGMLAEEGVDPDSDFAIVFPGARWETKVWPAERFAAAVDGLAEQEGIPSVLAGSSSEMETCRSVSDLCRSDPVNLAGRTSLRQLPALIEQAGVVLTNDSGPMAVADSLGRPMVAMLGPTNPVRTGPYHQPESVLRVELPCSPCYLKRLSRCSESHACMRDLSADGVVREAVAALRRREGPDIRNASG